MRNARRYDVTVDWKLFKVRMFGCYESSYDSSSDNDPFSPILSPNN